LFFDIPRKVFELNEHGVPVAFQIYQRKEANFLVEEFMILAN
jgi:exoribonuclease R